MGGILPRVPPQMSSLPRQWWHLTRIATTGSACDKQQCDTRASCLDMIMTAAIVYQESLSMPSETEGSWNCTNKRGSTPRIHRGCAEKHVLYDQNFGAGCRGDIGPFSRFRFSFSREKGIFSSPDCDAAAAD